MVTRELVQKHKDAQEPLSDKEVIELHKFYEQTANNLQLLGERFHHAWRAAYDEAQVLSSFKHYRGI